jgi:Secretion system C-terminal sorting domain
MEYSQTVMKHIFAKCCAKYPMSTLQMFFLFTMQFVVSIAWTQCPTPTFIVGSNSGTGIDQLSEAPAALRNMTGGVVEIHGTFTVDASAAGTIWQMRGVTVNLAADDSRIIVDGNCTLDASIDAANGTATTFDICGNATFWSGIIANFQSNLKLNGCNIRNACTAITLSAGTKATITSNNFTRNLYCIRATGYVNTIGDGIAHNLFDGTLPQTVCSGSEWAIFITNAGYIQIGDQAQAGLPNRFIGYNTGIAAMNSNIDVYNSTFSNGVYAIDMLGTGNTFNANITGLGSQEASPALLDGFTQYGIKAVNYNLRVQNARFANTWTEVQLGNSTLPSILTITNCRFETFAANGVLIRNSVLNSVNITGNIFRDNNQNPDYRRGVRIQVCQLAAKSTKGIVKQNEFYDDFKLHTQSNVWQQHVGTFVELTDGLEIESNNYFQNYTTTFEHEYKGVYLSSASNCLVKDNNFVANATPAPIDNFFKYRGFDANNSSNTRLNCNTSTGLNAGFYFQGAGCNGTIFKLNEMSDNEEDLLLAAGTIIGQQLSQQNHWPSDSPTEARFLGDPVSSMLAMSKFAINSTNMTSDLWADPRFPTSGWFEVAPLPHDLLVECGEETGGPRLSKSSLMVIDGTFEPYKAYSATLFDAKLFAFQELLDAPELRPANSPEDRFFNQQSQQNVGKLQLARDAWSKVSQSSSIFETNWNSIVRGVDQKIDEIKVKLEEINQTQSPEKQNQLVQAITVLQAELELLRVEGASLSSQFEAERNARANNLLTDLALINTNNIWESNLKTVLELLVQHHMSGNDDWMPGQVSTLQSIADQCRHEGGVGVVLARAALNNYLYDDESMCPGQTEDRSTAVTAGLHGVLAPNPAHDAALITFSEPFSGVINVIDLQGRTLKQIIVESTLTTKIDLTNFVQGVYFIDAKANDGSVWRSRLVVIN